MPDNETTTTVTTDPEVDGELFKREYLLHYIDAAFDKSSPSYVPIGEDLEEYNISMNAETETKKNIRGKNVTRVKKYEPQSSVETYFARKGSALATKLFDIINNRKTGNDIKTTVVDVLIDDEGTVTWAYREDAVIVVNSAGGNTDGVAIPYEIHYNGNRTSGTFNVDTRVFTVSNS